MRHKFWDAVEAYKLLDAMTTRWTIALRLSSIDAMESGSWKDLFYLGDFPAS